MFAENWCLKSNERIYGPYSARDLKKFAFEGRFAAWSLVAPAGSAEFKEACKEPAFADFFGAANVTDNARAFGKFENSKLEPGDPSSTSPRRARALGREQKQQAQNDHHPISNFVIVFDVVNAAASRVENALAGLGTAFRLAENVWSVSCPLTAIGVRNAIAPFLRPHETLFVIDASNGRTSWQNYAPEAHAKITQAYVHARHN